MKIRLAVLSLLAGLATLAAAPLVRAQYTGIVITQNGSSGRPPCYRVENTNAAYSTVTFTQPSGYVVTMYMGPGEVRFVGNPEPARIFVCQAGDGTPNVRGAFSRVPNFNTPDNDFECKP